MTTPQPSPSPPPPPPPSPSLLASLICASLWRDLLSPSIDAARKDLWSTMQLLHLPLTYEGVAVAFITLRAKLHAAALAHPTAHHPATAAPQPAAYMSDLGEGVIMRMYAGPDDKTVYAIDHTEAPSATLAAIRALGYLMSQALDAVDAGDREGLAAIRKRRDAITAFLEDAFDFPSE